MTFENIAFKAGIAHIEQFVLFDTFSSLFNNHTFIYRDILLFSLENSEISYCRVGVFGQCLNVFKSCPLKMFQNASAIGRVLNNSQLLIKSFQRLDFVLALFFLKNITHIIIPDYHIMLMFIIVNG